MLRWFLCVLALVMCGVGRGGEVLPCDRSKIGKPPGLIGVPLAVVDAAPTGPQAEGHSVDKAGERSAGYPAVAVGPGRSLALTLPEQAKGTFFLYLLVRSGHQLGYEYVHPAMSYTATLGGRKVALEPVYESAAVRVYQSKGSWGHDMGWVRSAAALAFKPGQKLVVGCTEKYAFLSQALLVSEAAHGLTRTLGRCNHAEARMNDFLLLARRAGEEVPESRQAGQVVTRRFGVLADRLKRLRADIDIAAAKVQAGTAVSPDPFARRATALADDLAREEARSSRELSATLFATRDRLTAQAEALRAIAPTDYYARDCAYAAGVAALYLDAARAFRASTSDVVATRRLVTYLWRAKQFVARAEKSRSLARPASTPRREGEAPAEPRREGEAPAEPRREGEASAEPRREGEVNLLASCERGSLLLNGVWELSTAGSPTQPPANGWQPMRVPHGPWQETTGQFMALDRKWPKGQAWAWYRLRFPVPSDWRDGALRLRFDAVFHLCEVYVNGHFVARHVGGFDPFEADITPFVTPGETATLLCFVHDTSYTAIDKSARKDQPTGWMKAPNHHVVSDAWGQRFGGIWQHVALVRTPHLSVGEVLVIPSVRRRTLTTRTTIRWPRDAAGRAPRVPIVVRQDVVLDGETVLTLPERTVDANTPTVEVSAPWPDARLWGIGGKYGDPAALYHLRTRLFLKGQRRPIDTRYDRFGFREFWIADGQFWLNGTRLPLQGGGTWYLQEGKIAHGHRWFVQRFVALERGMGVNIERWHRHGDLADDLFDVTDELGMLNEPEGPYWGIHGIPDILGYADFDDPVWVANANHHYRAWVRKHFNHPSIVLWSIENETFTRHQRPPGMLDRFIAFGDVVKATDPTRPITFHGSENGRHATRDPRIDIVNLHYPPNDRVEGWREKWGGRPCIDGEFQNYPLLFHRCHKDRKVAAEHLAKLQTWIEEKWAAYREAKIAGSFYFLPYMAALSSTARPEWMGPWGDLLPPLANAKMVENGWGKGRATVSTWVPIGWPSLSGPGIKCERLVTGTGHRSLINWFDPKRPVATPTPVYATLRKSWEAMPPLRADKAPEVIVTVTRAGKPVPGAAVLATPLDGQCTAPLGALTDPAGTAWIVFRQPGRYRLACGGASVEFQAKRGKLAVPPGFADVPRLSLTVNH